MARIGVYAGSFDPVTLGHEDIIRRAAKLFDQLVVTVMHNPAKRGCFTVEERKSLLEKVVADLPNVTVDHWDGLQVDYIKKVGAQASVRGLRAVSDFESEQTLAQVNSHLMPEMETIFLMTSPEHAYISSSVVREAASFGAPITGLVPACVEQEILAHFRK